MSGISPTKKRKANDGRMMTSGYDTHDVQTDGDGCDDHQSPPTQSCYGNLSQLDRMEKIMLRMEDKCNRLEAKCNSLENIVKEQVESLHTKIDGTVKQNEFNSMILKNQSWKYSAPVRSVEYWMNEHENDDIDAKYLSETSNKLREMTESLRQGKFPNEQYDKRKGISLDFDDEDSIFDDNIFFGDEVNNNLLPHWREFAAALQQFTPAFGVLPNGCESFFSLVNVQLNAETIQLLKEALMNKPFQELRVMNTMGYAIFAPRGMVVNAIIALVQSNKHLRKLDMEGNRVYRGEIGELCSSVHNHRSLVDLDLRNCFGNGVANEMVTSLLTNGELKLEKLNMSANNITSNVTTLLSDFLATDPPLKSLDLNENNDLNDDDAALLANALWRNRTLRYFDLAGTGITDVGGESFRLVLNGDSTLNSVSDSNHSCCVYLDVCDSWNMNGHHGLSDLGIDIQRNRARKIYGILSSRNKSMSNVQHFGDIDVNVLPHMVEAVQKYVSCQIMRNPEDFVRELSIVYEIMRKWDKVFPLYCDPK